MKTGNFFRFLSLVLILCLVGLACQAAGGGNQEEDDGQVPPTEAKADKPTQPPKPTKTQSEPKPSGETIRQWAINAVASAEYGDSDWNAMQATGAPNTRECGDHITAWASADSATVEWIELIYAEAVFPTEINVHQSYNPSQVSKVELLDTAGNYHAVYDASPVWQDLCPFVLKITVDNADYQILSIRITIDQTVVQSWNEIDAVELIGTR